MIDLCLINCKLSPESDLCCIGVENGQIASLKKTHIPAEKTIDVRGKIVLPGLIDTHVHFRDPGLTYKEDFKTGSQAAANGGFTTVLDMPNTIPPTNTAKEFQEKLKIASQKSVVDFGLHAGVGDLKEIEKIAPLHPASFKVFMDLLDNGVLQDIFQKIALLPGKNIISLHPEDRDIVNHCTSRLKSEGRMEPEDYAWARPALAEELAVSQALVLANHYQLPVHLCHISSKKSLQLANMSKSLGCTVSSEITPHHLFLDSSCFLKWRNLTKTNPPLRSKSEKISVSELDQVDIIGTDHAPHTLEEKEKNVWESSPGIPNLETTLKVLITHYNKGNISFESIKRVLCENPARIFNMRKKGFLKEGMDADIVIVDLKKTGRITCEDFYSKARYTPFEGFKYVGAPVMTLCRGITVMEDNQIFPNPGRHIYS